MLKTAIRVSGIGLAVCGLAVALAPAAGASPIKQSLVRPVTQTETLPTSYNAIDPCNGSLVQTTGQAELATVTTGQDTTVAFADDESGDGFTLVIIGGGSFDALASSYPISAEAVWLDLKDLADSFHASVSVTFNVTSTNAPHGISATSVTAKCGL
jgi:hypothetical protein